MIQSLDDLYLIGKPTKTSELEFQSYLINPMVVVAPATHKLAGKREVLLSVIEKNTSFYANRGQGRVKQLSRSL